MAGAWEALSSRRDAMERTSSSIPTNMSMVSSAAARGGLSEALSAAAAVGMPPVRHSRHPVSRIPEILMMACFIRPLLAVGC